MEMSWFRPYDNFEWSQTDAPNSLKYCPILKIFLSEQHLWKFQNWWVQFTYCIHFYIAPAESLWLAPHAYNLAGACYRRRHLHLALHPFFSNVGRQKSFHRWNNWFFTPCWDMKAAARTLVASFFIFVQNIWKWIMDFYS